MRSKTNIATICLTMCLIALPATAAEQKCRTAAGKALWTLIPSNDPIGRVLGPATGDLKAAVSAYLTSLTPQQDGSFLATSVETWVLGAQDILVFNGVATFTPVAGAPVGTVSDSLHLTVAGGTGAFSGATGTVEVRGTGFNLFGPNAAPGNTYFDVSYNGNICTVK